jgi:hypothetical protein
MTLHQKVDHLRKLAETEAKKLGLITVQGPGPESLPFPEISYYSGPNGQDRGTLLVAFAEAK